MTAKPLVPMKATTERKLAQLPFDNVNCAGGYSILMETGRVHIYSPDSPCVTIPRKAFDDMVMWYTQGLIPKSDKRKGGDHE